MENRFVPTYEPAMMRFFCEGRTETIRSCSEQSCAFVRAMDDPSVSAKERLELLKTAVNAHQLRTKQAMAGQGIDRHLFALYVVSRGKDINSAFLDQVLGLNWTLSTSQVPWRQASKKCYKSVDMKEVMVSSGGFGTVDFEGYGVCYAFMDDEYLLMHISSRRSTTRTNSERMMAAVQQAFDDMVALKDALGQPQAEAQPQPQPQPQPQDTQQ
jgi:DNA-binding PucR family transcriptional regulator